MLIAFNQTGIELGFLRMIRILNQQQTKRFRNGDTSHPSVITISLIPVIPL
jgi:hypothetical protein